MDATYLIVILALVTLGAVIGFALRSKAKVEKRMDDSSAPKSTLAADTSSTGRPADV